MTFTRLAPFGIPTAKPSFPVALSAQLTDTLATIIDALASNKIKVRTAGISDSMNIIADAFQPPPVTPMEFAGMVADELGIPFDEALAMVVAHIDAALGDSMPVINDLISAFTINMSGGSQRWVAPLSIMPRTYNIDPLFLAAHPVRHPGIYFEPRIKSYGSFTRAIDAPVGFMKTGDGNITVNDADNSIRQRIAAKTITGASAVLRLGPEGASMRGFLRPLKRVVGVVEQSADGELTIPLHDNIEDYLSQQIPGLVNIDNFPQLPEESAGAFAPIIYGRVSANEYDRLALTSYIWNVPYYILLPSSYSTEGGAIKPIKVAHQTNNYRYLIARHPCESVELWRKKYDASSFTIIPVDQYILIEEAIASGEICEIAKFTTNQDDYEIRANVKGLYLGSRYSFVGFHGRHEHGDGDNDYYTQIGLVVKDNVTGMLVKTALSGTNVPSNTYFEDGDIPAGKSLYSIKVWEGEERHIYNTQIGYKDDAGVITYSTKWGIDTPRGHMNKEFILVDGEHIEKITGLHGEHIDQMDIHSNLIAVQYGNTGGFTPYEIIVEQALGLNFADAIYSLLADSLGYATDRINAASFVETAERVQDLICAGAITEQITWAEAITRLQRSSNIDIFANKNDLITAHYTNDNDTAEINLSDLARLYKGTVKQKLAGPVFNQIPYAYSPNYANDSWTADTYDNTSDQIAFGGTLTDQLTQLYFVRDPETARRVIELRAQYLGLDSFRFEGSIPLVPVLQDIELASLVTIDHFGGIKDGGYIGEQFKILELTQNIDNLSFEFKGIRRQNPPVQTNTVTIAARVAVNARPGPYSNDENGELFGVFIHPTENKIIVYRTVDYGTTWAISDAAHEPSFAEIIKSYDCYQMDGELHIASQDAFGAVRYHVYDMASHSWRLTTQTVKSNLINKGEFCVSIEANYPDETLFIYFQGERVQVGAGWYNRGYYSKLTGTSWAAALQVTPEPTDYYSGGQTGCMIQRVISGRDNRMHFFYAIKPGNRWAGDDLFGVSMNAAGGISARVSIPIPGFVVMDCPRNIGGFCLNADRSQIYLTRREFWGRPMIEILAEGFPWAHVAWTTAVDAACGYSSGTDNPAVTIFPDPAAEGNFKLLVNHLNRIHAIDYVPPAGVGVPYQAGPLGDPAWPGVVGNIVMIRGNDYLTYFVVDGYSTNQRFRWFRVDTELPYVD